MTDQDLKKLLRRVGHLARTKALRNIPKPIPFKVDLGLVEVKVKICPN